MTDKQPCFVISPIGADGSDVRRRADQIFRHVITPAVEAHGFEAIRADKISEPGLITTQIIQHIVEDPLVIADLTGSNPNVFYELAIRHAIRKPLVQIIQKDEKIPFDVAGMRTIPVDHHDLDSVQEAKSEIEKQVKAVLGKQPDEIESPISVSLELQALRRSENPEDRTLAEIVSAIADLRTDISSIEKKISTESTIPHESILKLIDRAVRRPMRDMEVNREIEHRIMRLLDQAKKEKVPSKEWSDEIDRLRDMFFVLQHDRDRLDRGVGL
ncbi:hypothetical protein [Burkholderia multivorans]|uniref:hypothetical protein n=1 Tax=Burkholderia multivorans TaxID=87883 RepID=UPI0011B26444|nr:hypothetical protein [Burkholderia multivorans]MBR8243894.1 hypothetical protein [Burkholderia multivorans]MDN7945038.1 hypothetical protein [Burkholderia multivorans]MDR9174542.1 hypothetical protein [Burkholderia multivorans]MDR9179851.1 hypothetical protein [Burkholderia multivorans]MDR9185331.1 hypothetical protein [Burkholderia multivorans]